MASESFSISDLRTKGPRVAVHVRRSTALRRSLEESDEEFADLDKKMPATMIIDTGAQTTMIDKSLTRGLGLKHHGTTKVVSPGGEKICLTYDIDMVFDAPEHTVRNLRVMESDFRTRQGIDGVIGRDVLEEGLLIYDGKEECFTIAF